MYSAPVREGAWEEKAEWQEGTGCEGLAAVRSEGAQDSQRAEARTKGLVGGTGLSEQQQGGGRRPWRGDRK